MFSWLAQNSNKAITAYGYGTRRFPSRTSYMWDNKGRRWRENKYEGHGVFGGKDYFVLLAEMNREYDSTIQDSVKHNHGLELDGAENTIYPNLTDCQNWTWRNECPADDYDQGTGQWGSDYSSDGEDEYEDRTKYYYEDEEDGWPNGQTKPTSVPLPENEFYGINPLIQTLNPPRIMRIEDQQKLAKEWYDTSSEEDKYKVTYDNIKMGYEVVGFYEGVITRDHVFKNPRWIVMEKHHMRLPYDTTFVIMYCEGGHYVKMSLNNYRKIQDFCSENNEELLIYIEDGIPKGHCKHPSNRETARLVLEPIYKKNPLAWYQCFYY